MIAHQYAPSSDIAAYLSHLTQHAYINQTLPGMVLMYIAL